MILITHQYHFAILILEIIFFLLVPKNNKRSLGEWPNSHAFSPSSHSPYGPYGPTLGDRPRVSPQKLPRMWSNYTAKRQRLRGRGSIEQPEPAVQTAGLQLMTAVFYTTYIYILMIYTYYWYIYIHIYIWPYINMYNVLYVSSSPSPPSLFSCLYDFMWYFYGAGGQFQPGDPLPNHSYSCSWSRKVIAFHGNLGRFDPAEIAEIVEIVGPLVTSKGGNRWNMQELLVRIPTSSHRLTALFLASIHWSIDPSWPWHQWWSMVAMNP